MGDRDHTRSASIPAGLGLRLRRVWATSKIDVPTSSVKRRMLRIALAAWMFTSGCECPYLGEMNYPKRHPVRERIAFHDKSIAVTLEAQAVQGAVLGEANQARCLSGWGLRPEDGQLQLGPVDAVGALCQLDVRDSRTVPDQHDHGHLPGCDAMPPASLVALAALVVDPRARGQVNVSTPRFLHEGCDEDVLPEHVLVLYRPTGR